MSENKFVEFVMCIIDGQQVSVFKGIFIICVVEFIGIVILWFCDYLLFDLVGVC